MFDPRRSTVWALGLSGALLACTSTTQTTAPVAASQPKPAAEEDDRIRPLHDHMQEHFVRTDYMQKALVAGDLPRVREEAKWLLNRPEPPGMPVAWTPYVLEMLGAAADVDKASEPSKMANGIARMGAACGNCHRSLGLEISLTWEKMPPENMDPQIQMRRYLWAAERFWDGLVSSDDRGWIAGAEVFRAESLHSDDLSDKGRIDPHLQDMADDLHKLGKQADATVEVVDRVQLYGEVVSICASCHNTTGKGPASPPKLK